MKTLLVPTDFSPNAESALYYAMGLARLHSCKLILLNAIERFPQEEPLLEEINEEEEEEKTKILDRLRSVGKQIDYAGGITYEYCVETGKDVVTLIVNAASKIKADMIVMGTKGDRGAVDFIFGTITSAVIEAAICPVLAIPAGIRFDKPVKKMTYATEFLQSDLAALKTAATLAAAWDAELNIVHVHQESAINGEPEREVDQLGKFIKLTEKEISYKKLSFELLRGETAESRLIEYLNSGKTDMILLSTKHRNYFGRLLNGSLTQNLSRLAPVPLIAFHH